MAGKGDNSLQHYNLVHKFIPMPQAMNIPAAKAAVDKEWEILEKISKWNLTKVRSKSEVIDEARSSGAKVHFASLMDICHLKNAELEAKHQKYKGRVVLRGDIVKDDSGSYAVFTEQGYQHHKWQPPKSMVQYGRSSRSSWKGFARSPSGRDYLWERQFEKVPLEHGWGKVLNWECLFVNRARGLFLSVYVVDYKMSGKNRKPRTDLENFDERRWFGRTNIVLGPRFFWGDVLKENVQ